MFDFLSGKYALWLGLLAIFIIGVMALFFPLPETEKSEIAGITTEKNEYWLVFYRKSNKEELYNGVPGDRGKSTLIKTFQVKGGVPGEKPTPLPQLLGKEYWTITEKIDASDNEETAPYFLALDVPISEDPPYGPTPYLECDGQCDWELPGMFGLHGVAGDPSRLSAENEGSSGCIRHSNEDIVYLHSLLEIGTRYYIQDI